MKGAKKKPSFDPVPFTVPPKYGMVHIQLISMMHYIERDVHTNMTLLLWSENA